MSATEIIEQIEQLPDGELKQVFAYVQSKLDRNGSAKASPVSPEFKNITDKIFMRNEELFRKLAQ